MNKYIHYCIAYLIYYFSFVIIYHFFHNFEYIVFGGLAIIIAEIRTKEIK